MTTRIQKLTDLVKAKAFEQNTDGYTFEEYREMAEDFSKTHKSRTKYRSGNEYRDNEFEYWSLVEDPKYNRNGVEVEYAADLPVKKYGSAFETDHRAKLTEDLDV